MGARGMGGLWLCRTRLWLAQLGGCVLHTQHPPLTSQRGFIAARLEEREESAIILARLKSQTCMLAAREPDVGSEFRESALGSNCKRECALGRKAERWAEAQLLQQPPWAVTTMPGWRASSSHGASAHLDAPVLVHQQIGALHADVQKARTAVMGVITTERGKGGRSNSLGQLRTGEARCTHVGPRGGSGTEN